MASITETFSHNLRSFHLLGLFPYSLESIKEGKVKVKKSISFLFIQRLSVIRALFTICIFFSSCVTSIKFYERNSASHESMTTVIAITIYMVIDQACFVLHFTWLILKEKTLISYFKYLQKVYAKLKLRTEDFDNRILNFKETKIAILCLVVETLTDTIFVINVFGMRYFHTVSDFIVRRSLIWSVILFHKKSIASAEVLIESVLRIISKTKSEKLTIHDLDTIFKTLRTHGKLVTKSGAYFNIMVITFIATTISSIIMMVFIGASLIPNRLFSTVCFAIFFVTKTISLIIVLNIPSGLIRKVRYSIDM